MEISGSASGRGEAQLGSPACTKHQVSPPPLGSNFHKVYAPLGRERGWRGQGRPWGSRADTSFPPPPFFYFLPCRKYEPGSMNTNTASFAWMLCEILCGQGFPPGVARGSLGAVGTPWPCACPRHAVPQFLHLQQQVGGGSSSSPGRSSGVVQGLVLQGLEMGSR